MLAARDIFKAHQVLKNVVERTPLDFDRYLSEKYGATVYLKRENIHACYDTPAKDWTSAIFWW